MAGGDTTGYYSYTDIKGVFYGPGCLSDALPKLVSSLGGTRALIVTGKTLHTKTDVVNKVEDILKLLDVYGATFSDIGEHAPVSGINAGVDAFNRAEADFIVSVGGGSPIDASKAMAYRIHEQGWAVESGEEVSRAYVRQIAIPTTLSVAETTQNAGFTNEGGEKVSVSAPELVPFGIIYDADLTLSTPERLWLSSGMRALDHAVENLYRPGMPYPMKTLCYQAIGDLFTFLPKSKADPNDVETRQKLQIAAWMSLWPISFETRSAIGLSHSLGHRLGAKYHIPHGITSCLTLGPVVALQADIATPDDKNALARALSYLHIPSSISVENDIRQLGAEIIKLVYNLGLKTSLSAFGVPRSDLERIASQALGRADGAQGSSHVDDVVKLLESVY